VSLDPSWTEHPSAEEAADSFWRGRDERQERDDKSGRVTALIKCAPTAGVASRTGAALHAQSGVTKSAACCAAHRRGHLGRLCPSSRPPPAARVLPRSTHTDAGGQLDASDWNRGAALRESRLLLIRHFWRAGLVKSR